LPGFHVATKKATVKASETTRMTWRHSIATGVAVLAMQAAFLVVSTTAPTRRLASWREYKSTPW
jgi:hypothetical protein